MGVCPAFGATTTAGDGNDDWKVLCGRAGTFYHNVSAARPMRVAVRAVLRDGRTGRGMSCAVGMRTRA